ncbi:MAG: TonB-dependent receptor, partial [Bacteroidota bacterium]
MNRLATLVFFSFLFEASLFSQTGILKGIISEAETGAPLISASVQIGSTGTISDLDGSYQIELPAGEHEVKFTYVGYETKTDTVAIRAGEEMTLDVALPLSANILETATVTSGKFEKSLGEVTVSLDVIRPQLLESTNQTSLDGLLEKVPGVSFVGDQANIRGGSGFSYGAGSRVLLLVDDIPILQADAGFPQWEDVALENV